MINNLIDKLQRKIAKSNYLVLFLCKLRNQINRIISYHFSQDHLILESGEFLLIDRYSDQLSIVFDIGANKGEWTDYLLSKKNNVLKKLVLVEPSSVTNKYLTSKYSDNNIIDIQHVGLSNISGTLDFFAEDNMGETSSFIASNASTNVKVEKIKVTTLDTLCSELKIDHIDFLKIDCEGYDLKVLQGAENLIKQKSIKYIQFEYNHDWLSASATLKFAIEFLTNNGYSVFVINESGLSKYDYDTYGDFFGFCNFFAILN